MNGNIEESQKKKVLFGSVAYLPDIDKSLTKDGMCADAKATGDAIKAVIRRIDNLDPRYASKVSYNNDASGLTAIDIQSAIDELVSRIKELEK